MGNVSSSETEEEPIGAIARMETEENANGDTDGQDGLLNLDPLFEGDLLRTAAIKTGESVHEDFMQQHREAIIRWLDEVLQEKKQEFVTVAEFHDMLMIQSIEVGNGIEAFLQFDVDDEGVVDARFMLDCIKKYMKGGSPNNDLESSIRMLQMCPLTPGFFDIYNEDKGDINQLAIRILRFLVRNRANGSAFPIPALMGFNNRAQLRQTALSSLIGQYKKHVGQKQETEQSSSGTDGSGAEISTVTSCIASYEVSSNKSESPRLFTNDDTYWQSDGAARSHWIRFSIKNGILIRQLLIRVSSSDRSYMPQHVTVSVGHSITSMRELKDVRIPSSVDGEFLLMENLKIYYPLVQINIKRCHSDGCDTRIHGVKIRGYRLKQSQTISVSDSLAVWYLQIMASTVSACLPIAPHLRASILQHSRCALENLPPLSLSLASSEKPSCLTPHVLAELETFIKMLTVDASGQSSSEGLGVLLGFSLARGHLANILSNLVLIKESNIDAVRVGKLLQLMDTARRDFWKRQGRAVEMKLVGCDGGKKTEGATADVVLRNSWSSPEMPYLSGDGKTKVNMIFRAADYVQLTKIKLKVDKGIRGPHCGLIFAYSDEGEFSIDDHVKMFEKYDSWRQREFDASQNECGEKCSTDPVAFFSLEDDWDEIEVPINGCCISQYVLVKFLEPRQSTAERLGIVGVRFVGFLRKSSSVATIHTSNEEIVAFGDVTPVQLVCRETLSFLTAVIRDEVRTVGKPAIALSDLSLKLFWDAYQKFNDRSLMSVYMLHLFHSLIPHLMQSRNADQPATDEFYNHLCELIDVPPSDDDSYGQTLLSVAKDVVVDGAAVFFPDKDARRQQLFHLIKHINAENELTSVTLKFQSLCRFYSQVDPRGLLGLPSSPAETLEVETVLAVMETLLAVAHRECEQLLLNATGQRSSAATATSRQHSLEKLEQCDIVDNHLAAVFSAPDNTRPKFDKLSYLVRLLCSLQSSLLLWCGEQLDSEAAEMAPTAESIVVQYVELFVLKLVKMLRQFASCSKDHMLVLVKHFEGTFLSTAFPQMILLLSHLSKNMSSQARTQLLKCCGDIVQYLSSLATSLPTIFHGTDSEYWSAMERPDEVIQTWDVESPHNYENSQHITQAFVCTGATSFTVVFDHRCETEKKYDYLEFTDVNGTKTRCDGKVGSDSWPLTLAFKGGPRLQFLFHSDGSNNEWGYKFKVSAFGRFDEALSWLFEAYLNLSKLLGRLCGLSLNVNLTTRVTAKDPLTGLKEETKRDILNSELWMTLFRGGFIVGKLQRSFSMRHATEEESDGARFIWEVIEQENAKATDFVKTIREHYRVGGSGIQSIGGASVDNAIVAVFTALVWHTQSLREEIDRYAKGETDGHISDGMYLAYNVAESVRTFLVEERQKVTVERELAGTSSNGSSSGVGGSDANYDPVAVVVEKAKFLLKFAGLSKIHLKMEKPKMEHRLSKTCNRMTSFASGEQVPKFDGTMDKYPSFRLVLEFIRNPAWSAERVDQLLKERIQQAKAVANVYTFINEFIDIVHKDCTTVQMPTILLLQELMQCQSKTSRHYAEGLDGCGLELEASLRNAFYKLIRTIISSVRSTDRQKIHRRHVNLHDFVVAAALHLLDVNWQLYDLPFVEELKLASIYHSLYVESGAIFESTESVRDDAKELETYKRHKQWLEKYRSCLQSFYDNESRDSGRQIAQQFIAQYSRVLSVQIICDGCGTTVPGQRFRCTKCTDMDLCLSCFAGGILPPGSEHTLDHEMIYLQFYCDGCQGLIAGVRIHCDECEDFDLCLGCQKSSVFPTKHKSEHSTTEMPVVRYKLVGDTSSRVQAYIHQHVWLLYSSLALSVASTMYSSRPNDTADHDYVKTAGQIYVSCTQLAIQQFMKLPEPKQQDESGDDSVAKHSDQLLARGLEEKIMGLLGAMMPDVNKGTVSDDICQMLVSDEFITVLFSIIQGATGHEQKIQYYAFGLIKQLLLKNSASFKVTDVVLKTEHDVDDTVDHPTGYHTIKFLFMFGIGCFEKRGSKWAGLIVRLIQRLYNQPNLKDIIHHQLSQLITVENLTQERLHSAAFALYVVAGFPEIMDLGAVVKYTDAGVEPKSGIILEIFQHRNETLVINKKTRKRKTLSTSLLEFVSEGLGCVSIDHLQTFMDIVKDGFEKIKSDESGLGGGTLWILALSMKALLKIAEACQDSMLPELHQPDFIRCIVSLAALGSGMNRKWIVENLEELALSYYFQHTTKEKLLSSAAVVNNPSASKLPTCNPLDGLDDSVRDALGFLSEKTKMPLPLLRAYHDCYEGDLSKVYTKLTADSSSCDNGLRLPLDKTERQTVQMLMKKWDVKERGTTAPPPTMTTDDTAGNDVGVKLASQSNYDASDSASAQTAAISSMESLIDQNCAEESEEEKHHLICSNENDLEKDKRTQREKVSLKLLAKELETIDDKPADYLCKLSRAMTVLYARKMLLVLLADKSPGVSTIVVELGQSCASSNLPYILDLLSRLALRNTFQKVVQNVIQYWRPEGLASIVQTVCMFLKDVNLHSVTRESPHGTSNNIDSDNEDNESEHTIVDKVFIPGATFLSVTFDARCCTEDDGNELVMSSSDDFLSDRTVFGGENNHWKDFDIPGSTLYYKYSADVNTTDWGFKFTVTGGRVGKFRTGYMMLESLLGMSSIINLLPLNDVWHSLISVACRQTGQPRLKAIQLLIMLLHSQFRSAGARELVLDLRLLLPLWRLNEKLLAKSTDHSGIASSALRAFTELFFIAENLALEWDIAEEYVSSLSNPSGIEKSVIQGMENIAAISLQIGYENTLTKLLKNR